ncbi:MAG: hypothetical protein N3A66_02745 [Planctomycetota bacterium]|nr:hypothetical protein [Planctomycetota bacterium]
MSVTLVEQVEIVLKGTPQQREVVMDRVARRLAVFAGRRFGKTVGIVRNRIIARCMETEGFRYLFTAPSFSQVEEEYEEIGSHPQLAPYIKHVKSQPHPRIDFDNGSMVCFRSLDKPKFLRGGGWDEVWVDEIQDVPELVWYQILSPLVADRRGVLGCSGQFRGTEYWTYKQLYLPGQDRSQNWIRSWSFPTWEGFAFQTPEGKAEIERYRKTLPAAVFDQEFACIPTANQNAVFRPQDIEAVKGGVPCDSAREGGAYVIGLDIGRIVDPTAIVVLEIPSNIVVYCEVRPIREKHEDTAQHVARISHRFGDALVVMDATGGAGASATLGDSDAYVKYYREALRDRLRFL